MSNAGLANGAHLRDRSDRIDIRRTSGLHTDEGEGEAEEQRENGLTDVHMEKRREDGAAHDDARCESSRPPERRYAILFGRLVLVLHIWVGVAAEPGDRVHLEAAQVYEGDQGGEVSGREETGSGGGLLVKMKPEFIPRSVKE